MLEAAMVQLATLETEIRSRLNAFEEELRSRVRTLENSRARGAQRREELEAENRALRKAVDVHLQSLREAGAELEGEKERSNALFRLLNGVLVALKPFAEVSLDSTSSRGYPDALTTIAQDLQKVSDQKTWELTVVDFARARENYRAATEHPIMDLGNPAERAKELVLGPDVDQKTVENFEEAKEAFGRVEPSLEVRVKRLESWVHRVSIFASHQDHCAGYITTEGRCDCGYEQLRAEIRSCEEKSDAQS